MKTYKATITLEFTDDDFDFEDEGETAEQAVMRIMEEMPLIGTATLEGIEES